MMRIASPGPTARVGAVPAGSSPTTTRSTGESGVAQIDLDRLEPCDRAEDRGLDVGQGDHDSWSRTSARR